jgi:hypothetical protein
LCTELVPDEEGLTTCNASLSLSETQITATVIDPDGESADVTISVEILPNTPPTVLLISPQSSDVLFADEAILLSAIIDDAEDDNSTLSYEWTSSIDGVLSMDTPPSAVGAIEATQILSQGDHELILSTEDAFGKSGEARVEITVLPGDLDPSCTIVTPTDGAISIYSENVVFEAQAEDDRTTQNQLITSWSSDIDGDLGAGILENEQFRNSSNTLSTGLHTITFLVTDNGDHTCSDSISLAVGSAPIISLVTPISGSVVSANTPVEFSGIVTDGEDAPDSLALSWESNIDGVFSTDTANADGTISITAPNLSLGMHNVIVTATDALGFTGDAAVTFRVNNPPSVTTPTLSNMTPSNGGIISCSGTATDADSDPLTETYEWTNDTTGTSLSTFANLQLSSNDLSPGDTLTCTYTASDGYDSSSASTSATVNNALPIITNHSLFPSTPGFNETIECQASINEPDGETYTESYEWTNDTTGTVLSTTTPLVLDTSMGALGDQLSCTLTVTDASGGTATSTTSAQIEGPNAPPIIASLTLTPDPLYTNENLSATISTSDPDGDLLSFVYEWKVSGTVVQNSASNILASSLYNKNEEISLTLFLTDGVDTTSMMSTIICQNSLSTAPTVTITPAAPIMGIDDLTCSLTGTSTDADGDTVSYEFSWSVDGVPYSGANNTSSSSVVSAAQTDGGEEWICTVTPNDGQDDGVPGSTNVDVDYDVYGSCLDIYNANTSSLDGLYFIDMNNNGIETEVFCDMSNGGWTYEDFGMGQYDQTHVGWEVLDHTDFSSTPLAEAFVHFYNLHGLTNITTGWNSNNCCFISPSTSIYYGFAGSIYMYPSNGTSYECNSGYNNTAYYFYTNSPTLYLNSMTLSQAQNIGTYSSCSTSGNPAVFAKRWY